MATEIEAASWQFLFWILEESLVPFLVHSANIAVQLPFGEPASTNVAHPVRDVRHAATSS
jgi:hypothetical protein